MDEKVIEEAVNREFHSEEEDFEYNKKSKKSIIEQIQEYAESNNINLEEGWKVKIAKKYVTKDRKEKDEILSKWKSLFVKLQEIENID